MMKKVNTNDLIDGWLKYHNTTVKEVEANHPEWMENPREHTREFYSTYAVTQEQHDEWQKWAKEYTKKITKVRGKMFDRAWPWVYLDTSPSVKPKQ